MSIIIAIRCPHCGANVSRTDLKCRYCGTELIIIADGIKNIKENDMLPSKTCSGCNLEVQLADLSCPTCGAVIITTFKEAISVFNQIETETAKSQRTLQRNFLEYLPSHRTNDGTFIIGTGGINQGEKAHYVLPFNDKSLPDDFKIDKETKLFAITSERLIFVNPKKYPRYLEIPLDSIVSVSPISKDELSLKFLSNKPSLGFNVFTKEKEMKRIEGMTNDSHDCAIFWCYLINAIVRHSQTSKCMDEKGESLR